MGRWRIEKLEAATMHRPLSEKILICLFIGAGLFASIFGVLRLVMVIEKFQGRDLFWIPIKTDLLCGLELMIAIIAASLPCLKAPTQRVLGRLGFLRPSATNVSLGSFLDKMTFRGEVGHQLDKLPLGHSHGSCDRSQGTASTDISKPL
jgi:hypothetical protein